MKKNLIFFIVLLTNISICNCQTFRTGYDPLDYSSGNGQGASLYSNVISKTHQDETVALMAYINMFLATHDKRYLDKFIIHSKRVQERRDDNILNLQDELTDYFPGILISDGYTCTKPISSLSQINSENEGWSYVNKAEDCEYVQPAVVHSGTITYPMAQFVYYMQNDAAFMALANELVPLEAQTVPSSNACAITSISTYSDYANWLLCRIEETYDFHDGEWDDDPNDYLINIKRYIYENINGQTSLGRTIALLYLITGDPIYHKRITEIALLVENHIDEHSISVNGTDQQYYTWYYGWYDGSGNDSEDSEQCIEDISHAWLTMQFAEICYSNQITNFNDGTQLFDLTDMQLFANTFAYSIYKEPLDSWQSTDHQDNLPANKCGGGGPAQYTFLAKYNPYIFQIQADGQCEAALYSNGASGHQSVFSELALLQSKNNLPNTLNNQNFKFNPVAVARDESTTSQVFKIASGDFDGDGLMDLVSVDQGTSGGGLIRAYSPESCNNSDKNGCWQFAQSAPHGFFEWRGMASGDFNDQSAPFNNPGDELMALDENGNMYLFKNSGPGFAEWINNNPFFDWSGLTSGNFLPGPTDEGVAITTTGVIHFITYNTGAFQVYGAVGTTGFNDVVGITAGQFDATDSRPQVAILDETSASLRIYSYNVSTNLFVQIHEFADFGSTNEFTSLTSGDYDGDGIDEIAVHRNKDGQMFILKVKTTGLAHIYSEYFPVDQSIGALTTGKFNLSSDNDELVVFRNFDGQITIFNIEGHCPNLYLDALNLTPSYSIDNDVATPPIVNDYDIDYHVENVLTANDVEIFNGTTANFVAGKAVVLKSGTTIQSGSVFHAYIEPTLACGDDQFLKSANASAPPNKEELNSKTEKPIDEIPIDEIFSATIFPNPSDGSFVLQLTGINQNQPTQIGIFNSFGEMVYESSTTNARTTFDLKNQAKGIYFVKVQSEGNVVVKKVVIQ